MKRLLPILLCATALGAAEFPAEPGPVLVPGANDAAWRPLFEALAAKGAVAAAFMEQRWFQVRDQPVVLEGEMRFSPERGLSLSYRKPEKRMVIADAQGLVLRDARGRSRAVPAGPESAASLAALLPVMHFDFATLVRTFEVHAARAGAAWRLDFVPRNAAEARILGRLVVCGEDETVRRLEFRKSEQQRIVILLREARTGVVFTPEDLRRFFR